MRDFIAPDLKTLAVPMEALERELKVRFDQAGKVELERFAAAEKMAALRHETALAVAAANHAFLLNAIDMDNASAAWRLNARPSRGTPRTIR